MNGNLELNRKDEVEKSAMVSECVKEEIEHVFTKTLIIVRVNHMTG